MKCLKRMLASVLLLLVAIKFLKRVASVPIRTKRSINANQEDEDNHSLLSKPKIPNYSDDLDNYFLNDDDEDNISGFYDNIEHQPIPMWKINLNRTSGDMRLDPIQALIRAPLLQGRRVRRAAQSQEPNYLWRYNTIFYKIDNRFDQRVKHEIKKAISIWKKALRGCLKFVRLDRNPIRERRISNTKFGGGTVHHILFTKIDNYCWSNVGRTDTIYPDRPTFFGQQVINIGDNCGEYGTLIHEIGHAVGFYHEHSRKDREEYIKILSQNILSGIKEQFDISNHQAVESMGYAYDFVSIMHYGLYYFTKREDLQTIRIRKRYRNIYPKKKIGQRDNLSYIDIAQVRAMYKCNILPSPESKKTCVKRKTKGQDYKGRLDYTRSGVMCQPWDKKYPHNHNYKLSDIYNGKHNYCRNPGGKKERPWCFTTLGPGYPAWEYCDLKFCDEKKVIS